MFAEIEHGVLGLPAHFWGDLLAVIIFGLVAVFIVTFATKVFDWVYTKVDYEKEVGANNIAAAIVVASVIIGLSLVMMTVIRSVVGS